MDLMVLVKQRRFDAENEGRPWKVGDVLKWRNWTAKSRELAGLSEKDRLWMVTARPGGKLWLVGRYSRLRRMGRSSEGFHLRGTWNTIPVADISNIAHLIRFTNRRPIDTSPDKLGNSLQTPGFLSGGTIELLENVLGEVPSRHAMADQTMKAAFEGSLVEEVRRRRTRDRQLRLARLGLDQYTCQACDFTVPNTSGLEADAVLEVHHIDPLHDSGPVLTDIDALITLCPTCHRLLHVVAASVRRVSGLHVRFLKAHVRRARRANRALQRTALARRR